MNNSESERQNCINQSDKNNNLNNIPTDMLKCLIDNPYEHLILIDKEGIIRFLSQGAEELYLKSNEECIGCHISEVNSDSKMLRVLKTGKAELVSNIVLNKKKCSILRFPLKKEGRIVGVAGKLVVITPDRIKILYKRIDNLKKDLSHYKRTINQLYSSRYTFDNIIGNSPLIKKVKTLAQQIAETESSVLIVGESGTGKELIAHSIHQHGRRKNNSFIEINCSSIPEKLMESELFGYSPGAFTDASKQGKIGKFELADKGTIFLDEIGDMPLLMQVKLMRTLQEKFIVPIGGEPKAVNFRLISATNRNLEDMVQKKKFRLDLFYRLNVVTIKMPALREIKEDIPILFSHFLEKFTREERRPDIEITPEVLKAIQFYAWPGNIRELKNVVERATIVCQGNQIELNDLPANLAEKQLIMPSINTTTSIGMSLKELMEETERQAIINALKKTRNNKANAAELLKIHRTGLYQKSKKYNII